MFPGDGMLKVPRMEVVMTVIIDEFVRAMTDTLRRSWKIYAYIFCAFLIVLFVLTAGDVVWRMF
ncbi:MAG: hypothetical protein UY70_C0001G0029 [Candidatus Kaiserbacteria bacterium GW2011_GWB1_52_6]|uniref:Uncharacterized protein n=2 Tax=Candidatus Kaiseribacteriota TaxID=1752734 RepID=A0A0G1XAC8_9BACT|nr:MAG: hypothetical protein UY67_C0007G0029 [Candidatus Kaiserbacteria bacterium GW2011_GWA2_52_12]KKW28193.1 MAG: hypothetical protein UY70_C0001G0029 [Candidatus Kaiserbacteria bacterium GW2011_GWB1_52_6]